MKAIRIFLLVLIIIGIGLLLTQKIWVPKLVNKILSSKKSPVIVIPKIFSKEDAVKVAQQYGMLKGYSGNSLLEMVSLKQAEKTGNGEAWFISDEVSNASTKNCPKKESDPQGGGRVQRVHGNLEMNVRSGVINFKESCGWAIVDY
jgi:hypothetical protein